MRTLPSDFEKSTLKQTYYVVEFYGGITYRFSSSGTVITNEQWPDMLPFASDWTPKQEFLTPIANSVAPHEGTFISNPESVTVRLVYTETLAGQLISGIGPFVKIGITQLSTVDLDGNDVVWLFRGRVNSVSYDRDFIYLTCESNKRRELEVFSVPNDYILRYEFGGDSVLIPILYGDWLSQLEGVWYTNRDFVPGVPVVVKYDNHDDGLVLVGDHEHDETDDAYVGYYWKSGDEFAIVTDSGEQPTDAQLVNWPYYAPTDKAYYNYLKSGQGIKLPIRRFARHSSNAAKSANHELAIDGNYSDTYATITPDPLTDPPAGPPWLTTGWFGALDGLSFNADWTYNASAIARVKFQVLDSFNEGYETLVFEFHAPDLTVLFSGYLDSTAGTYTRTAFTSDVTKINELLADPGGFYLSVRYSYDPDNAVMSTIYIYQVILVLDLIAGAEADIFEHEETPTRSGVVVRPWSWDGGESDPRWVITRDLGLPREIYETPQIHMPQLIHRRTLKNDFETGRLEHNVCGAKKGREFGTWISGRGTGHSASDVITDATYILEDIIRSYIGPFAAVDIDNASFDVIGNTTDGTRKAEHSNVYISEKTLTEEIFEQLLLEKLTILRVSNQFAVCSIDADASATRTIRQTELTKDADPEIAYVPSTMRLPSEVVVSYRRNEVSSQYECSFRLTRNEFISRGPINYTLDDSRTGSPDTYTGLMYNNKYITGVEGITRSFELAYTRKPADAELVAKRLIDFYCVQRRLVGITLAFFNALDIEVGDVVELDLDLVSGTFMVIRWELDPEEDTIVLNLLELGV